MILVGFFVRDQAGLFLSTSVFVGEVLSSQHEKTSIVARTRPNAFQVSFGWYFDWHPHVGRAKKNLRMCCTPAGTTLQQTVPVSPCVLKAQIASPGNNRLYPRDELVSLFICCHVKPPPQWHVLRQRRAPLFLSEVYQFGSLRPSLRQKLIRRKLKLLWYRMKTPMA